MYPYFCMTGGISRCIDYMLCIGERDSRFLFLKGTWMTFRSIKCVVFENGHRTGVSLSL